MPRPHTALHPTGQNQTDSTQGLGAVSVRSLPCNLTLGTGKAMTLHVLVTGQTEKSGGSRWSRGGAQLGCRLGWHPPGKAFRGREEVWSQCEKEQTGVARPTPDPCLCPPPTRHPHQCSLEQPSVRNPE